MGAKFFQMNFKQNFFCGKSASMHQIHLMQLLVVRAETHQVTHDIFPIWGNAVLCILSYYENVCKVRLESSMLYKWPLWSHALVQVSRLSIDAIGTIVSSYKQAKIHQCDSIICAPWSVKMMWKRMEMFTWDVWLGLSTRLHPRGFRSESDKFGATFTFY